VLDANTGDQTGEFNSDTPPAFIGNLALYFQSGTLVGVDIPSGQQLWSFGGDGGLTSAPVIVNQTIYIGSSSGTLFGLNTSGQQIWTTQVGAAIPAPDEFNDTLTTGLGAGDGLLIIPTASILVSYGAAGPSPTPTPTLTGTPTPTATATATAPGIDESVAWQNNTVHDGFDFASPLVPPLSLRWSRNLSANGVISISYPLIVDGSVFVTTTTTNNMTHLMALDENTGSTIWSLDLKGDCCFANAAYDSGKVFALNTNGLMAAFDASTGNPLWSVLLPGQSFFTSPPTAVNGMVFTGGAESGGTVYAVDETNGQVLWTMSVENGDSSSPAVVGGYVYVSYACPQSYAFNAVNGQQLWHYK
jgi:outer membrane protein assembly factor BamB